MAFGWAGAAAGAQQATDDAKKLEMDLQAQLAQREYQRQRLLLEQAQHERLQQQMGFEREQFDWRKTQAQQEADALAAKSRQAINDREAQAKIFEGILTKQMDVPTGRLVLAREGVLSPQDALKDPAQPTGDTQWVVGPDGTLVHRVPTSGDRPYEKPPAPSTARPDYEWVIRDGQPLQIVKGTARSGDRPYSAGGNRVLGTERTALSFYNRAKQADDAIIQGGYEERFAQSGLGSQVRGSLPNIMQSPEQQAYRAAQRAFTEARLRKESGAAVPPSEYDNDAKTYFAQPGDSPAVIAQKRMARQAVLDGIAFSAGSAYEEYYGEPAQRNAAGVQGAAKLKWDPVSKKWIK